MSPRHQVESFLRAWREAERLLEHATGREAELIERQIAYYQALYQDLFAGQTDAATAGLREVT